MAVPEGYLATLIKGKYNNAYRTVMLLLYQKFSQKSNFYFS